MKSAACLCAFAALTGPGCASGDLAREDAAARQAAYEQCLQDNMAVAMAWTAIEAMCHEKTGTEDPLSE